MSGTVVKNTLANTRVWHLVDAKAHVKLTGRKLDQKVYYHHTGFPGGIKETPVTRELERKPENVIVRAVSGMLPKNKLRAARLKRLRVFATEEFVDHSNGVYRQLPRV